MMFSHEDLIRISLMNRREGNPNHLSTLELIQLKAGEDVGLVTISKARALLDEYKSAAAAADAIGGSLQEEVKNLSSRMMLIYMLLVRKGILGETEIFDLADELKRESEEGPHVEPTGKAGRPSRTRRKRTEAEEPTPSVYTACPPSAARRGANRTSPRTKTGGTSNTRRSRKSTA